MSDEAVTSGEFELRDNVDARAVTVEDVVVLGWESPSLTIYSLGQSRSFQVRTSHFTRWWVRAPWLWTPSGLTCPDASA